MLMLREQFNRFFLDHLQGDILVYRSPHVGLMTRAAGFTPDREPNGKYDTVIGEYDATSPEHPVGRYACKYHFLDITQKYLNEGGKFIGKFPLSFVLRFLMAKNDKTQEYPLTWVNITDLYMDDESVIVYATKEESKGNTKVHYHTGEEVTLDLATTPVLHHYSKEHYDYLFSYDESIKYDRVIVSGRGGDYPRKLQGVDLSKCVFFYGFGSRPKVVAADEINQNISCDFFVTESHDDVMYYQEASRSNKVLNLIDNLSYNELTSLKAGHKHYIINPQIKTL